MNKVAISNIAWPGECADEAYSLCAQAGFAGIELAPAMAFEGWPEHFPDTREILATLAGYGLEVPALQGILYGVPGIELFGSRESRERLAQHLCVVAKLAGALGARCCVYGAPRNRDPGPLSGAEAQDIACAFFTSVANAFEDAGTCIGFEANDETYGCKFVTRTAQAVDLVRHVGRPGFRVHIDTGTIFLGDEDINGLREAVPYAAHLHVSEPDLRPIGSGNSDHRSIAAAIGKARYDNWISVEMLSTGSWRSNIATAAELIAQTYRSSGA